MRFVLAIGMAAVVAVLGLASASAGPPAQAPFVFASTHGRPLAGTRFTGLTVAYISTPIAQSQCHASVSGKPLAGRQQAFYANGISGAATISCSWRIPKATAGKLLTAWVRAYTPDGAFWSSGKASWRVKP